MVVGPWASGLAKCLEGGQGPGPIVTEVCEDGWEHAGLSDLISEER